MKTIFLAVTLFTGIASAVALYPAPDNPEKEKAIVSTTINALSGLHYKPLNLDDSFSEKLFDSYLERIDGPKRYFLADEFKEMKSQRLLLDDQLQEVNLDFFNLTEEKLEFAIDRAQGIYREILSKPFDFSKDESLELDGEKVEYAANLDALKDRWRKVLKWETLNDYKDNLEAQEKAVKNSEQASEGEDKKEISEDDKKLIGKSKAELEEMARESVLKTFNDWFDRIKKLKRNDRLSDYMNAITNIYDPHTGYFAPLDKENFDINMAGKLEGIGARLQTDGNYTKVVSIIVGGPAWKGKELSEKDVIIKVAQEGEEAIEIGGMNINEVVQQIRGPKGTKVTLTVKKVDGSVEEVVIVRDVVVLEEGFAKSLILEAEDNKKVGYVRLPRFYADFKDANGRSCFVDVRTEVEKLKSENVKGIILDLRSNGGGSLKDVVDMTGLFIEEGPIVQVKSRDRSPEVLEDTDDDVQYSGPLVVMVNEFSASASEILAAALQDYKRAVIVGTKTFGKGTVQRFIDLDLAIRGAHQVKPLGNVKVTTQKFYRINGGSTQLEGVTPDILLPDSYSYLKTGERENENALAYDKIRPATYNVITTLSPSMSMLKRKSEARVKADSAFQEIDAYAKRLKQDRDDTDVSLNEKVYDNEQKERKAANKAYKDLFHKIDEMKVNNLKLDKLVFEGADETKLERNQDFIERIEKDLQLFEAVKIVGDMIDSSTKIAGKIQPKN